MNRWIWLVLGATLIACAGGDGDGNNGDDDGTGSNNNYGSGNGNGVAIPSGLDVAASWEGDLSDGTVQSDLSFLVSAACDVGTEFENYDGAHVYYTYEQPAGKQVYVRANPERGVDVSLIVSQAPEGSRGTGPADIVNPCERSADVQTDSNPGESEAVKVTSIDRGYHLIIGVIGAQKATEGAFLVEVFEE